MFAVHMWNPNGPEPKTIWDVMARQKDLQYSSRAVSHIARQRQIHKLRHVISDLVQKLPDEMRKMPDVEDLAGYGCRTRMHVVRLVSPPLAGADHSRDIDFSASGIRLRWEAGYTDTAKVLAQAPWASDVDPLEGFILHETEAGRMKFD